jgi:hypothetical protein
MFSVYFQFGFSFPRNRFSAAPCPGGVLPGAFALWDNPLIRRGRTERYFRSLPLLGGALLKPDAGSAAA